MENEVRFVSLQNVSQQTSTAAFSYTAEEAEILF